MSSFSIRWPARTAAETALALTLLALAFRLALSLLAGSDEVGPLFFSAEDRFADAVKTGLAIDVLTAPLQHDPRVQSWPVLFQSFLFDNRYLQHAITVDHSTPLGMVLLIFYALVIVLASPVALLCLLTIVYVAGALITSRLATASRDHRWWPVCVLLLSSYPAVFMFDRGNFQSGFVSLFVVFYVLSAVTGRARFWGFLAIALAINLRPNTITLLMIELVCADHVFASIRTAVRVAALTIGICVSAFVLTRYVDPHYSIASFRTAYALYDTNMVKNGGGLAWNASLLGVIQTLAHFYDWPERLLAIYQPLVLMVGGALGLVSVVLCLTRRATSLDGVFLACALSALFTPVYAEYHLLVLVAPLLVAILRGAVIGPRLQLGFAVSFGVLLALCWLDNDRNSALTTTVLVGAVVVLPRWVMVFAKSERQDDDATAPLIVMTCLLSLCPIGGEYTQGIVIGLLITSCLLQVISIRCLLPGSVSTSFRLSSDAHARHPW